MNPLYLLLALLAGIALAAQVAINAKLRFHIGTPMQATLISFCVGGSTALLVCLVSRYPWPERESIAATPTWAWFGGLLGVFYLWASVVSAPQLGVAMTFGLVIAGQVTTSLLMDHFGLFDLTVKPANLQRIIGVLLIIAGVTVLATNK